MTTTTARPAIPHVGIPGLRLVRSEFRKIRTTNAWWLFGIASLVITGLTLWINLARAASDIAFARTAALAPKFPPGASPDQVAEAQAQFARAHDLHQVSINSAGSIFTSGQFFGLMLVMLLGILVITNEFQYQTATATFLTTPQRTRVVIGKLFAVLLLGFVFWLVSRAVSFAAGLLFFNNVGLTNSLAEWPVQRALIFNLLAYLFAPVLGCLVLAQIGLLLLLGVVLFLKLEPDRPFLAGAALVLPFAKPHLLVLFWLAVFLWSLDRRKWAVLSGLATATVFATLMVLWFDPAVFQHYRMHLATASIEGEFIPSFPGVLRLLFFRRHFWVQFVPLVLGVIWCCTHYLTRRSNWEWRRDAAIVMAISVVCAPYGWLTDDAVLLPAILQAAVWIYAQRTPGTVGAWLPPIAFALFNGLLLLMLAFRVPLQSGLYFWSSLLWASWCLYGYSRRTASPKLGLVL